MNLEITQGEAQRLSLLAAYVVRGDMDSAGVLLSRPLRDEVHAIAKAIFERDQTDPAAVSYLEWADSRRSYSAAADEAVPLKRDADRYQWLKKHAGMSTGHFINVPVFGRREQTLDEAIDGAMRDS